MKSKPYLALVLSAMFLSAVSSPIQAETLEEDFAAICGWYKSLASDEKFKDFTTEKKFTFVFDPKTQSSIKNIQLKSFYAALRTTQAAQRFEFIKSYAEGTLGKSWDCPPMQQIMAEFVNLAPLFQYAK